MIKSDDTALLFLPFFHVYGQVATLLSTLAFGARTVIMERFDMVDFLTFFARYKVASGFFFLLLLDFCLSGFEVWWPRSLNTGLGTRCYGFESRFAQQPASAVDTLRTWTECLVLLSRRIKEVPSFVS